MNATLLHEQTRIISILGVKPSIDPSQEIASRVQFVEDYLRKSGAKALVLGISGGVDSSVAGMLCQLAVENLKREGYPASLMLVRLPYGIQRDEQDAQAAIDCIRPDQVFTINIKGATDAMMTQLALDAGSTPAAEDFTKGNVKARQRMIAQYALAGANNGLVVGTDHAAEALMGFFTKFGDGGADIIPLSGLTKDQVQQLGMVLDIPGSLVFKTPSADLEDLVPGKPDEDAFGVKYTEINSFLKGEIISIASAQIIVNQYNKTEHKRREPVAYV